MADFVPGNIIQTPDFGQMAQGYVQQYRQEEAAKNKFLDEFDKKQGLYLDGYKPAVQESWNNVQSVMDLVAEDDSPENRRKLKEAYGEYSTAAGTAQYLSDEYRKNIAAYKADPAKFAVNSDEFLDISNDYKLRKRTRGEMLDEVNNPFFIQRSSKYQLLNPYDQAKQLVSDSKMKLPDFYNAQGQLNRGALRAYAEKRARAQVNALPDNVERAMVWGAPKEGYPEVNSIEDLQMISALDDELKQSFVDRYVDELTNNYMDLIASQVKIDNDKDSKLMSLTPYESTRVIEAEAGTGEEGPKNVEFQSFEKPLSGSLKNIVGFGFNQEGKMLIEEVIQTETKSRGKTIKNKENVIREANPNEKAQINGILRKDYGISISEKSVSSQEQSTGDGLSDEEYNQWLKDKGLDG
jgi:hypothetical protein